MSVICKFVDPKDGKAYYMEWSTISDGPNTFGMSLEEFMAFSRDEHGRAYCENEWELPARMKRVEEYGSSSRSNPTVDEVIELNRAGKEGGWLSKEEILEFFCRNRDETAVPDGIPLEEKYPEMFKD